MSTSVETHPGLTTPGLTTPALTTQALADRLKQVLGAENVLSDPDDLEFYSTDIYQRRSIAELVVRPHTIEQVAEATRLCTENDRAVIPRGGGLSYTGGYLPVRDRTITFDLAHMNRIVEINETDMYATVECGVTWSQLYEALKAKGLRATYFGTASGYSSTIGGALSQNSTHFGSVEYGTSADGVLGLEVVLADGTIVKTGSGSQIYKPTPFFRNFGPDLTGLFLGDTGALGFKIRATLRLIPFPEHQRYASFAFDSLEALMRSMAEVSRRGLAAECGGWDPAMVAYFLKRQPVLAQDLKYLKGVLRSGSSLLEGLKDATRIAVTGRRAFKDVAYLMHVTIDEFSACAADEKMKAVEKIAEKEKGRSAEPTFPRSHRAVPFNYPNGILGPTGKRWAPSHGLAPHSRAIEVAIAMHKYFDDNAALMEKHGIEWVLIMSEIYNNTTLIEPMFYWPDRRSIFHERWIEKDFLATVPEFPRNDEVAEIVKTIRSGLTDLFMREGCSHLQIGKIYRYKEGREANTFNLLSAIKNAVDPKGLMNPGSLGLD
jgi:FAD/FMN-containing dehydrogenase